VVTIPFFLLLLHTLLLSVELSVALKLQEPKQVKLHYPPQSAHQLHQAVDFLYIPLHQVSKLHLLPVI
jgi:hypothetical protein